MDETDKKKILSEEVKKFKDLKQEIMHSKSMKTGGWSWTSAGFLAAPSLKIRVFSFGEHTESADGLLQANPVTSVSSKWKIRGLSDAR